jgi:hypothetical protein
MLSRNPIGSTFSLSIKSNNTTMTEKLNAQKLELEARLAKLDERFVALEVATHQKIIEAIMPTFTKHRVLQFDSVVKVSYYNSIQIERVKKNGYKDTLLTLSIEDNNKIHKSFYSTNDNSMDEVYRMVILGKVGELILESSEEFVDAYRVARDTYDAEHHVLLKERYEIQDGLAKVKDNLRAAQLEDTLQLLRKGVRFVKHVPHLTIKYSTSINIQYLRVVHESGANAIIEVEYYRANYSETMKVRFDNIVKFAKYFKQEIEEAVKPESVEVENF